MPLRAYPSTCERQRLLPHRLPLTATSGAVQPTLRGARACVAPSHRTRPMVGVRGLAANGVSISDPHVIQITVDANESLSWMDLCRRVGLFPSSCRRQERLLWDTGSEIRAGLVKLTRLLQYAAHADDWALPPNTRRQVLHAVPRTELARPSSRWPPRTAACQRKRRRPC